jgi:hypothetical protein
MQSMPRRSRRGQRYGQRVAAQHHRQYEPPDRLLRCTAKQLSHIHDRSGLDLDRISLGCGGGLLRLQAGQHIGFALALGDQLRTGFALGGDGIECPVDPAAFRDFLDGSVNLI